MARRITSNLLLLLNLALLILYSTVMYLQYLTERDRAYQQVRVHQVQSGHLKTERPGITDEIVNESQIRLNEVQLIGTHNSYKKMIPWPGYALVIPGSSKKSADALKYGYEPLQNQLKHGYRAFEIDLRYSDNEFQSIHVPLVDARSNHPIFKLTLRELKQWSDQNPDHFPLLILLELKSDWMFLDPSSKKISITQLTELNAMIQTELGSTLYKPGNLQSGYPDLRTAVRQKGWPSIGTLKGKILFYLHPGEYTETYANEIPDMAVFPAVYSNATDRPYSAFVVHNQPGKTIRDLVDSGFMVRTRIDKDLNRDEKRMKDAVRYGAQILMTDFARGRQNTNADFVTFENHSTVTLRK